MSRLRRIAAGALLLLSGCSYLEEPRLGATRIDNRVVVVAQACGGLESISKIVVYEADDAGDDYHPRYDRDVAVFRFNPLKRNTLVVPIDGPSDAYSAEIKEPLEPDSIYAIEVIDQDGGYAGEFPLRPGDLREGHIREDFWGDEIPSNEWPTGCEATEGDVVTGLVILGVLFAGAAGSTIVIVKDRRRRRRAGPIPPGPPVPR